MDSGDIGDSAVGLFGALAIAGIGLYGLKIFGDIANDSLRSGRKKQKKEFDIFGGIGPYQPKKGKKKDDYFDGFWDF